MKIIKPMLPFFSGERTGNAITIFAFDGVVKKEVCFVAAPDGGIGCGDYPTKEEGIANAKFIVKACNTHDDLASALRQIATYDQTKLDAATLGNIARNALAKADIK